MSQLKLTADSGGGTVAIKAPASTTGNAAFELTVPGTGNRGLGKILQVVNVFKGDRFTSNSNSFTDITNLSVAITPTAANSKILVQGAVNGGTNRNNLDTASGIRTMRSIDGGTFSNDNKLNGAADGSRDRITFRCLSAAYNGDPMPTGFHFSGVADPSYSVGNEIIYKLQVKCQSSYVFILNGNNTNTDNADIYSARHMSSLIAMEFGG